MVEGGAEESGGRDGERVQAHHDAAGDAPADGGDALRRANAGDGSGDDVGGADGNAGGRTGAKEKKPPGRSAGRWKALREVSV